MGNKTGDKTFGNSCSNAATKNVKDIQFWGDGDYLNLSAKLQVKMKVG